MSQQPPNLDIRKSQVTISLLLAFREGRGGKNHSLSLKTSLPEKKKKESHLCVHTQTSQQSNAGVRMQIGEARCTLRWKVRTAQRGFLCSPITGVTQQEAPGNLSEALFRCLTIFVVQKGWHEVQQHFHTPHNSHTTPR